TSVPIRPGRGRVYAVDAAGRRLVTTVPRGGGRVRVTLSVWDDTDIVHRQVEDGRVDGPLTGAGPAAGPRRGTPLIPQPREDRR
ncbi:MAG: hypothetical protein U1A07_20370, partial [Phenylobacterium sp.]|nr:hypothetical protein [Phenylobacterium sp.]